jgi:hypothetical protein
MPRSISLPAAAISGAAALLFAGGAGAAATSASASPLPVVHQAFSADSGDKCLMGFTKGAFGWPVGQPGGNRVVEVSGVVGDRPSTSDPVTVCGDDGRFTIATFIAYAKTVRVDTEIHRVNNGQVPFTATLTSATSIDRIVVRVCRHSLLSQPDYCGIPKIYEPPITIAN